MIICPEIKKIAGALQKIERLSAALAEKIDTDGLDFKNCYLVDGCREVNEHLYQNGCRLDNGGLVDDVYYCDQYDGYGANSYYGTLYYKTNVPGQFVAVPFEM